LFIGDMKIYVLNKSKSFLLNLKPSSQTVLVSYFWAKQKHETNTLLRLSYQVFVRSYSAKGKGPSWLPSRLQNNRFWTFSEGAKRRKRDPPVFFLGLRTEQYLIL